MNNEELKQRTKAFALRAMNLVDHLPEVLKGPVLGNQLLWSATSVAANYRAACRGRSEAEFISKLGTVLEEADESALWLELIIEGELLPASRIQPLLDDATNSPPSFSPRGEPHSAPAVKILISNS